MPSALTPRPMPARRLPIFAGGAVLVFALPIFVLAGWRIEGWLLGAVLWVVSQLVGVLIARAGIGYPTLRGSGVAAFGMMLRGILIMVVAVIVATSDPILALAGALVYALTYSAELGFGLALYFSGETRQ